jgi:NADPH:quinone reductase-like Zn-dependent oxidoreductase
VTGFREVLTSSQTASTLVFDDIFKFMKAISIQKYGKAGELKMVEIPVPVIKPDEILVKNYYTTINPMDYKARKGELKLFIKNTFPKILGVESSGIVEQVGVSVQNFKKGDRVMTMPSFKFGTDAEFSAISEKEVFALPDAVSFEEAAALPMAGGTAYCGLHQVGKIKQGDSVLINGAYGGIGSFAVQLAKLAGANVTGICSTENIENVKMLGADTVLDYTKQDIYTTGKQFDIVFDTVGKLTVSKVKKLLRTEGTYVTTVPTGMVFSMMLLNVFSSKKIKPVFNSSKLENMNILSQLVAQKKLKVIVDKEYTLEELSQAHEYSESGKAKGKILIKI